RIMFSPLARETMEAIVGKAVAELAELLTDRGVSLELSASATQYFADKGYDRDNGARPLARLLQDEIKRPLGDELLFGALEHGGHVRVDHSEADGLTFSFEETARPSVAPASTDVST